jgi:hypothetical protein
MEFLPNSEYQNPVTYFDIPSNQNKQCTYRTFYKLEDREDIPDPVTPPPASCPFGFCGFISDGLN